MKSCLVLVGSDLSGKIVSLLEPDYTCRIYHSYGHSLESMYENFDFTCLIVHITNNNFPRVKHTIERMRRIRPFPVIAIIQELDLEIARLCGETGIDRFIEIQQLPTLRDVVSDIDNKSIVKVRLADFSMNESDYPALLIKALKHIEENYVSLAGVSEIAQAVGVSVGTLSRLFKKHIMTGPKRLLMQFKLFHAINLMKLGSLSLTRIAAYSGFSCEKRLNECFNSYFKQSAKHYRENFLVMNEQVNSFQR